MKNILRDRVALITGASRGIGKEIALAYAAEGAKVAINYHRQESQAREILSEIEQSGGTGIVVQADVSSSEEALQLVEKTRNELGPIEVLVNNAGITHPQKIEDLTVEDWDLVMNVNLRSMFVITQAVLPDMRKAKFGRIINLSSVAAQLGGVVGPHYAASKAGAIGLTHSYAHLLCKEGITSNAIAPALIYTDMVSSNPNAAKELIPLGRFGDVKEVSDIAVLLATNGYINGQTINVNGGWYMSS